MRTRLTDRIATLLMVALIPILLFVMAGGVLAGKPSRTSATLNPSCNPCEAGAVVHFAGSGYEARLAKATLSFAGAVTTTPVWADGTISHDWPYFSQPGEYWVRSYQASRNGRLTLKAEVLLTVVP